MRARHASTPHAVATLASIVFASLLVPLSATAQIAVSTPLPGVQMAHMINVGRPTALLVVDLCAAGIEIRTTRHDERGQLASSWAASTGVDIAINADFFVSGYSTVHFARSGGADWPAGTHDREPHPNIAFGPGFAMRGELPPPAGATDVIGGIPEIVGGGMLNPWLAHDDFTDGAHRRTAVGLSADRRKLFVFSTDGTQSIPGVHWTMAVMAASIPGAPTLDWALNLDGGGSSQMWMRGVGTVIPSGRAVANHLGIYARGSGPSPHCPPPDPVPPPPPPVPPPPAEPPPAEDAGIADAGTHPPELIPPNATPTSPPTEAGPIPPSVDGGFGRAADASARIELSDDDERWLRGGCSSAAGGRSAGSSVAALMGIHALLRCRSWSRRSRRRR